MRSVEALEDEETSYCKDHFQRIVIGILDDELFLDQLLERLRSAGFSLRENNHSATHSVASFSDAERLEHEDTLKGLAGMTEGSATGAVIGGMVGLLVEISGHAVSGSVALVSAGPLLPLAVGLGVGATIGGIAGMFRDIGFSESVADRYQQLLHDGAVIVSIHCSNEESADLARSILELSPAHDIEECDEAEAEAVEGLEADRRSLFNVSH